MMFFFFVCHFALLLSFWFHTKTFCRYVHIIGDGCECVSVFLSFGLCIVCILAFFGVIVVSPSMVPYTCMWNIRVHVCSLKFVSTRNMFLTFAHIQPFKSAQYVILILTSHSRIIFHLFLALWMDFMPGCFLWACVCICVSFWRTDKPISSFRFSMLRVVFRSLPYMCVMLLSYHSTRPFTLASPYFKR